MTPVSVASLAVYYDQCFRCGFACIRPTLDVSICKRFFEGKSVDLATVVLAINSRLTAATRRLICCLLELVI
jgi:hypothetical protein